MTQFYGRYNVTFTKLRDTGCNIGFSNAGQVTLAGNSSGSDLNVTIFERADRFYRGSIDTSGSFSGRGSGLVPGVIGLVPGVRPRDFSPAHEFVGDVRGHVRGNSIEGVELLVITVGCPRGVEQVDLAFQGNR